MRRQILLASVGAIAIAGSAFAADLPYRGPPPVYLPPPPIFTWSGLYVGGQIGYAWGNDPSDVALFTPAIPVDDVGSPARFISNSVSSDPNGVIGGAHIGYNLQIGQWVAGLEATVDGTSMSGTAFDPISGITVLTRSVPQGSIRARAGIAFDRVLLYATGGVAFADITTNYTDQTGVTTGVLGANESISQTRAGWTVGGGLEYAVTNNWSVRAEYRYSDFGHFDNYPFTAFAAAPNFLSPLFVHGHLTENQVQAGFSYHFNSYSAPVVAKY